MFGQVPPTEFDLRFRAFGIPVRVHPVFWLSSAFLAWDRVDADPMKIVIRILCIFLAILVHELGHALVTRRYGWNSEIVLYFFGGYATSARHSTWKDIAVSAAGPGAGFLLYFGFQYLGTSLADAGFFDNRSDFNMLILDAIGFSLFINLVWNAINLLPVLPLDGGQICRELCLWFNPRKGMEICLLISILSGGGVALWSLKAYMDSKPVLGLQPGFLAIMFGYLAYQSYQTYEQSRRGYR